MFHNRQRKFFILILPIVIACLVGVYFAISYDENTTHPALTYEIIDLYNRSFPNQPLSKQEAEWVIKGSIDEDIMPRWTNHFYDPTQTSPELQGWRAEEMGNINDEAGRALNSFLLSDYPPVASKYWAQLSNIQAQYKDFGGNRTWQRAIYEMSTNNDRYQALYTLGHILHLIEDASVPDHTRNDTHAHPLQLVTGDYGSPYEEYTKKYVRSSGGTNLPIKGEALFNSGIKPVVRDSLNSYFDAVASYSNNYFFSKDTIPTNPLTTASADEKIFRKYQLPEIIEFDDNFGYGYEGKNKYKLARTNLDRDGFNISVKFVLENPKIDESILTSYFTRLSREAIVNGAGIIKLFFDEVAKAKNDGVALSDLPIEKSGINSTYVTVVQNNEHNIFSQEYLLKQKILSQADLLAGNYLINIVDPKVAAALAATKNSVKDTAQDTVTYSVFIFNYLDSTFETANKKFSLLHIPLLFTPTPGNLTSPVSLAGVLKIPLKELQDILARSPESAYFGYLNNNQTTPALIL
ncbi:MAG: hypothetical protein Q7R92_01805, partial [bacterium]|nr:hypothetical protein [bacterium]